MKSAVIAAAILALAAVASAQTPATPSDRFPYATCSRPLRRSTYSTPKLTVNRDGSFCVTLGYDKAQCTEENACCKTDVNKFELDVNPECEKDFSGRATLQLDGKEPVGTRQPSIRFPPNAVKGKATLFVTGLGLSTPELVDGAVVCVYPSAKSTCNTFAKLAVEPENWATALWDSSHKCCPVTRPPPPPPPPAGCKATQEWRANFVPGVSRWSFLGADEQAIATAAIEAIIAGFSGSVTASKISFKNYKEDDGTEYTSASVELQFGSDADGAAWIDYINGLGVENAVNPVFNGADCTAIPGQTPQLIGTGDCAAFLGGAACALESPPPPPPPAEVPFPFCPCQKTPGATQFAVTAFVRTSRTATWTITGGNVATGNDYCKASTVLDKAEFYFLEGKPPGSGNKPLSANFVGSEVSIDGGAYRFVAPAWGGEKYPNTYKVAKLGLTADNFKTLKIRITLKTGVRWTDVTADPSKEYLWISLFDHTVKCCPTTPWAI